MTAVNKVGTAHCCDVCPKLDPKCPDGARAFFCNSVFHGNLQVEGRIGETVVDVRVGVDEPVVVATEVRIDLVEDRSLWAKPDDDDDDDDDDGDDDDDEDDRPDL